MPTAPEWSTENQEPWGQQVWQTPDFDDDGWVEPPLASENTGCASAMQTDSTPHQTRPPIEYTTVAELPQHWGSPEVVYTPNSCAWLEA